MPTNTRKHTAVVKGSDFATAITRAMKDRGVYAESTKQVLARAHETGLSDAQFAAVMGLKGSDSSLVTKAIADKAQDAVFYILCGGSPEIGEQAA